MGPCKKISLSLFCLLSSILGPIYSHEDLVTNPEAESQMLQNIQQLTFPSMGFEKAGEAYFSPDGKTIIFQAVPKGKSQYQIYTMSLEERIPRMVSTGYGACTCAYFRPDGQKIIFASSHNDPNLSNPQNDQKPPGYKRDGGDYTWDFTPYMNIYEANPDGSCLKSLTTGQSYHAECAYSPDGLQIVFASNRDGSINIYTMKSDGSDIRRVTKTDYSYNGGPFFSPDGKKIVFRSDRQKPHYLQIFTIDVDGSNEIQLSANDAVNWAPYWHPSGKAVAFTTSLHGHKNYEVYLLNIESGKMTRVTYHAGFDGLPVFSPNGEYMMWTSKRGIDNTCQIFLAEFKG